MPFLRLNCTNTNKKACSFGLCSARSVRPADPDKARSPGKSAADRLHQDQITVLDPASRTAADSARGTDAAEVFACSLMQLTTFSGSVFMRLAMASMIRWFA